MAWGALVIAIGVTAACRRDSSGDTDAASGGAPSADARANDGVGANGQGGQEARSGVDARDAVDLATGGPNGVDASASTGCKGARTRYGGGSQPGSLDVGGRSRSFVVHLPPAAMTGERPLPLVLLFHGGLGTGAQIEESARMSPIADREGFVVVYPDGVGRTWNGGGCCGPAVEQQIDDVAFVSALLAHLNDELCLDRKRVYAGGMSNGAIFSHRIACDLSERFAAVASVAGTNMAMPCAPTRPVALIHIHGTADFNIPWYGGMGCGLASNVIFPSVAATISAANKRNACALANPALIAQQGDGRCERQGACTGEGEVVLCTVAQRGHSWPGGAPDPTTLPACDRAGDGGQSTTFLASEQIWAFFARHSLP
jgi:polyhydroxybutyrate depolymerase